MILEDDSTINMLNNYNRNAITENENLKPKFIIQPKRVTNMDLKQGRSNFGTLPEEIQLCPLELRPLLKKSSSSVETNCNKYEFHKKRMKTRIPRRPRQNNDDITKTGKCNKTGDMYRNILGPTPDESILAGLQTVIDLCGLIDSYKEDTDLSPTRTGSGHAYHQQEISYPCTFETRIVTSSKLSNIASTDDANETFLTAPDYSLSKSIMECPYDVRNNDSTNTKCLMPIPIHSYVTENGKIVQRSPVSRDDSPRKLKFEKSYSIPNDIDYGPTCNVCPQCVKEIELLPNKTLEDQTRQGNACECEDICTKPLPKTSNKAKLETTNINEDKEKHATPRKKEKTKRKGKSKKDNYTLTCDKCPTCLATDRNEAEMSSNMEKSTENETPLFTKKYTDFCDVCLSCTQLEESTLEMEDKNIYPRTSQGIRPSTSADIRPQSKEFLINQSKPLMPKSTAPSKKIKINQQNLPSSDNLLNVTNTTVNSKKTKMTEECNQTKLTCEKNVCPNRKKKTICCPQKNRKKDVPENKKMKGITCPVTISNVENCNICDECIKKISGRDFLTVNRTMTVNSQDKPGSSFKHDTPLEQHTQKIAKQKETCDARTDFCDKCTACVEDKIEDITVATRNSGMTSVSEARPFYSNNQPIGIQTESNVTAQSGNGYRIVIQPSESQRNENIKQQEYASGIQSANKIPGQSVDLRTPNNVLLMCPPSCGMYRKTHENRAGSRISIIEEENIKPVNYQVIKTKRSPVVQPKSSESAPETSSDIDTSESSVRPSRFLHDVKEESSVSYERMPIKVGNNDMTARSTLSTKCFPPVEIPPVLFKTSATAIPSQEFTTYSSPCKSSKGGGDRDESRIRSSHRHTLRVPQSKTSSLIDPGFGRRKEFRRSGMQVPNVQPVVGVCSSQCAVGDRLLDVRYAVVKISVFEDYTTYEIMRSSTVKPKKIPDCVEGIFVTKR